MEIPCNEKKKALELVHNFFHRHRIQQHREECNRASNLQQHRVWRLDNALQKRSRGIERRKKLFNSTHSLLKTWHSEHTKITNKTALSFAFFFLQTDKQHEKQFFRYKIVCKASSIDSRASITAA